MATSTSSAVAPSYTVGESRSESLIAIVTCMMALSTLILALRVWTRARVQGIPSAADEWTILVSWMFSIAFTINVCIRKYSKPEDNGCGAIATAPRDIAG
jgi:hypothetical protein